MKVRVTSLILLCLFGGIGIGTTAQAAQISPPGGLPAVADAIPQRYGIFEEPLIALGEPSAAPEPSLLRAISTYKVQGDALLTTPIEDWLKAHPGSAWAASLYLNVGLAHEHGGDYAPARLAFQRALTFTDHALTLRDRAVGERAMAELLEMETHLGHVEAADQLLRAPQASWGGYASAAVSFARAESSDMRDHPQDVLRCGLVALSWLLHDQDPASPAIAKVMRERADKNGISLERLQAIANRAGVAMAAVHRGAGEPVPVPSVVHWKEGHYAAILGMENGRYRVRDTVSEDEILMRPEVLDRQSSGYFLVLKKTGQGLPWKVAAAKEAQQVVGSGPTSLTNTHQVGNQGTKTGSDPCNCPPSAPPAVPAGMPHYAVSAILVSLNVEDKPVSYVPAKGPSTAFVLTYNQLESDQPSTFNFSNVGGKWTHNWISYVQDDPSNPGSNVTAYMPGGGAIVYNHGYNGATGTFTPETKEQAVLARVGSGSNVYYERRLGDGSVWTFSASDGSTTFPRRLFLTRIADPQGNAVTLTYDATLRLSAVTDALGQSTTFTYGASNPLLLTGVTDPFGRTATIGYDSTGRLNSLTDAIGMQSTFTYDTGTDIVAMTTPYGTTSFSVTQSGRHRTMIVTDPLGAQERFEFYDSAPGIPYSDPIVPNDAYVYNAWFNYRNIYYWDRNAMAIAAGDYTKAHIYHFLHDVYNYGWYAVSGVLENEKSTLENRVWYSYPDQPQGNANSDFDKPIRIRRVLDDGTTQHTILTYNAAGHVTSRIDKAGLQTTYTYDANLIDLLQVTEKNAAGNNVVVATYTYNGQHRPLTYTDAAGLTTTYTYNSAGQVLTATDSQKRVTTWKYDNSGQLLSITRPDGSVAVRYTYDAVGRVATKTNALGYTLAYAYDNLDRVTKVTYPDGTFESTAWDKLDVISQTDRAGHTTSYTYNADRQRISETDALGHIVSYTYYPSSQVKTRTDANGNVQTWNRDIQGRVTSFDNAGEVTSYTYDSASRNTRITRPDGSALASTYDGGDRLVAQQDSLGDKIAYTLDLKGDRIKEEVLDGAGHVVRTHSRVYDSIYRLQQDIGAQNQTTQYAYDIYSNVTSATDPLGRVTSYTYDALNRLDTTTQPGAAGPVTRYAYNGLSQITQVTDPRGLVTGYTYDGLGNLIRQVSPDTGTTVKTYDVNNNVLTSTDAKGQVAAYAYDALNRVTGVTYTGGTAPAQTIAYQYDQGVNGIGHLTGITDATGVTSYGYDPHGRLVDQTDKAYGGIYATTYTYDAYGRLAGMTYPSGRTLAYTLDVLGRVSSISTTSKTGKTHVLASNIGYEPFGGVHGFNFGDGTTAPVQSYARSRDQDGRIATYTLNGALRSMGYDPASQISFIADPANLANIADYGYDPISRLTSYTQNAVSQSYNYDVDGNRTSQAIGSTPTGYTYGAANNWLTGIQAGAGATQPVSHDANGATTADTTRRYAYDLRGRLIETTTAQGAVTYAINALGQRVRKQAPNANTDIQYHYDSSGHLIAENPTGAAYFSREYVWLGDIPVTVLQ